MIKNPLILAKKMGVDLQAIQVAWGKFHLKRERVPIKLIMQNVHFHLGKKECDFLMYIGLDCISKELEKILQEETDA